MRDELQFVDPVFRVTNHRRLSSRLRNVPSPCRTIPASEEFECQTRIRSHNQPPVAAESQPEKCGDLLSPRYTSLYAGSPTLASSAKVGTCFFRWTHAEAEKKDRETQWLRRNSYWLSRIASCRSGWVISPQ